jgi:hypothetical protein
MDTYPILVDTLAAQSEGMTPLDVAELLDNTDEELARSEHSDVSDDAVLMAYLNDNVVTG